MQLRQGRSGAVTRWSRLAVLLVLAAGFSTMHGFLAVSASADTHLGQQHGVVATHLGTHAGAAGTDPAPAPDRPAPTEHHDLVAGCVVALVGIGLVGLALLLRRRPRAVEDLRALAWDTVPTIGPSAARWSAPRVALCVIRV